MPRALIVDDSKFMRRIIRETLESGGHIIAAEAVNGYEAVTLYKQETPDFVTMDVTMMGKDGLKAVDEIIAIDPDARIIVISALGENTLKNSRGIGIPARGFLQKPFEKEQLLSLVQSIL
jgi:two-component system chemotaxis response regulator CheY